MADEQHQIVTILVKYALQQPLDEKELRKLEDWRSRSEVHDALPEQFRDPGWVEEQRRSLHVPPTEEMWADIRKYIDKKEDEPARVMMMRTERRIGYGWFPVAVLLLAVMLWSELRLYQPKRRKDWIEIAALLHKYKVLLALDDGSMIALDTLHRGAVVIEGDIRLKKTDSNSYVYSAGSASDESIRHQLTIAKGAGICRVEWPDGSKVWLKAGSSVDYTVDIRAAETALTGEAWFRVAHDPNRPVIISMPGGEKTKVLGTSFNIRTGTKGSGNLVTLFSGAVRVVKRQDSALLRPGFQATTGGKGVEVKEFVDSNAVLAWLRPEVKLPYFDFSDADLLAMLPEIAGWYRVTVVNPHKLRGAGITGEFARTMPLPALVAQLNAIEGDYVKMSLQEDTIYITPLKPGG